MLSAHASDKTGDTSHAGCGLQWCHPLGLAKLEVTAVLGLFSQNIP